MIMTHALLFNIVFFDFNALGPPLLNDFNLSLEEGCIFILLICFNSMGDIITPEMVTTQLKFRFGKKRKRSNREKYGGYVA